MLLRYEKFIPIYVLWLIYIIVFYPRTIQFLFLSLDIYDYDKSKSLKMNYYYFCEVPVTDLQILSVQPVILD